jgi:hypothetical protein
MTEPRESGRRRYVDETVLGGPPVPEDSSNEPSSKQTSTTVHGGPPSPGEQNSQPQHEGNLQQSGNHSVDDTVRSVSNSALEGPGDGSYGSSAQKVGESAYGGSATPANTDRRPPHHAVEQQPGTRSVSTTVLGGPPVSKDGSNRSSAQLVSGTVFGGPPTPASGNNQPDYHGSQPRSGKNTDSGAHSVRGDVWGGPPVPADGSKKSSAQQVKGTVYGGPPTPADAGNQTDYHGNQKQLGVRSVMGGPPVPKDGSTRGSAQQVSGTVYGGPPTPADAQQSSNTRGQKQQQQVRINATAAHLSQQVSLKHQQQQQVHMHATAADTREPVSGGPPVAADGKSNASNVSHIRGSVYGGPPTPGDSDNSNPQRSADRRSSAWCCTRTASKQRRSTAPA